MSLRTLLIIIGVLIVVAVYAVSVYKRRRESRLSFDRRFARLDVPDVILRHDSDEEDELDTLDDGAAFEPRLPDDVILPPEDEVINELPAVRNDNVPRVEPTNARKRIDQMDLFGLAEAAPPMRSAPAVAVAPEETPVEPGSGLVTLYVRARSGQHFTGTTLVKAFNGVGMQFGDMSIFHHFGAGELRCDVPVFSAANMFEPGTFNLGKIEAFRTSGVALFMQLPGPLDGPVAFELLLNTAQRLTELAGGELFANPKSPLDSPSIARMRKRVARFSHVRT